MSEPNNRDEPTVGWADKRLKLAGYGYSLGDVSMAAAAHLRGEKNVMGGALIWLAGGIAAARYGNPPPNVQLELLGQKLQAHLQQQGVTLPSDPNSQHALLQKPGFFAQCQQFLYQHPSEMLNAAYGIGAALLLKDGVGELMRHEKKLLPSFVGGLNTTSILNGVNGISKISGWARRLAQAQSPGSASRRTQTLGKRRRMGIWCKKPRRIFRKNR